MVSRNAASENLSLSKYPTVAMFGPDPRRLTPEQAVTATANERIESVWRFLIRKAIKYVSTLSGSEASNYDLDDVLMELYIELREKDGKWTPDRGRYITFAAKLAQRHLIGLRDKARTVQSPRNSSSRMAEYRQEIEDGTITEDRYRTYEDIRRSASSYTSIGTHGSRGESDQPEWMPGEEDDSVAEREHDRLSGDAITWGIMCLTPFEARVLGMSGGLWGQPKLTLPEIAERTGRSRDAVKKAKDRSEAKIRHRLLAMGHPAVASDN